MLLVLVAADVVGGLVFLFAEMLVPSFVVYPLALLIGSYRLVRGQGTTGVVFLTVAALVFLVVHYPFGPYGPEGDQCPECSSAITWPTVFALPLALFLGGAAAWADLRRQPSSTAST